MAVPSPLQSAVLLPPVAYASGGPFTINFWEARPLHASQP